jgi:PiT family inorganic phosphate transporter
MYRLLSGIFMGWSLGSNDSANVFGTAVFSKKIRYRTAVILCAVFVIAGALLEGRGGMHTLSGLVDQTADSAFAASLAAALTVTLMSMLKLPVSTSQAAVGAIIGIGILRGEVNLSGLTKVVMAWVATPLGTILVALLFYPLIGRFLRLLRLNIFIRDLTLKWGLIIAGCYGAYALGANNVANVTGVYIQTGQLTIFQATLLGGASIALGSLTYSRNVMITVGKKLVRLDPYGAFIAAFSMAVVVHGFAIIGVPVSASQAIIGAVLGIGILKGVQTIRLRTLLMILFGWIGTPSIALAFAYLIFRFLFAGA